LDFAAPENQIKNGKNESAVISAPANGHLSEVDKLREENKRLKRTLQERFEAEFQ
jgi:hypothetical protein